MSAEPDFAAIEMSIYAHTLADTLTHYDHFRAAGARDIDARHAAELYLRRKCEGMLDADGAAIVLADALARRASERINAAEAAIIQR